MAISRVHAEWLEARRLDVELADRYGLASDRNKHGDVLVIPYVRNERVIRNKYRLPGKQFRQDPDRPRSFWNEDCLRDHTLGNEPIIVTEGELDALAAIQSGFVRSISVPDGADSNLDFLGEDEIWALFDSAREIIIASDGDVPGQKLQAELVRRFSAVRCKFVEYPEGCKDLNDVLRTGGEALVRAVIGAAKPFPIKGLFRLSDYPDIPEPETYSSGWINLGANLRLWRGEFMVVTGVPSAGKSLWTTNLMANLVEDHGHRVAIASFEMRIVPYVRDILRKHHGGSVHQADAWIGEHFVFIDQDPTGDDEDAATVDWIIARAEDAVIRYGIHWLVIDPWNQVERDSSDNWAEERYQRHAIKQLKRFARAYNVGVVVVAHPTKDVKQRDGTVRRPTGYDISGSAHWYNAADHLIVIWREGSSREIEVIVEKSRFVSGGAIGSAWLRYEPERGRYVPSHGPEPEDDPSNITRRCIPSTYSSIQLEPHGRARTAKDVSG